MKSDDSKTTICSFCHAGFQLHGRVVYCPVCRRPYHRTCWKENGNKCSVLGCPGKTKTHNGPQSFFALLILGICAFIFLAGSSVTITKIFSGTFRPFAIVSPSPTVNLQMTVEVSAQRTLASYIATNAYQTAVSINNENGTATAFSVHQTATKQAISTSIAMTSTVNAALTTIAQQKSKNGEVTKIAPTDGMTLVFIPAGSFIMGGNAQAAFDLCQNYHSDCELKWFTDEEPQHTVYLDAYWIDQTEVTTSMYEKCVKSGVCQAPRDKTSYTGAKYYGTAAFANYPVINVSWDMAKSYCEWAGRRLPTEAEWEKAARGTDGRIYPWGNAFEDTAVNFCDRNCPMDWALDLFNDGYAGVSPVASYPSGQSPYGIYDMAGNIFEWVNDWYSQSYYQHSPDSNPLGPSTGTERARRGGAWFNVEYRVRTSYRDSYDPLDSFNDMGFRCASSP